MRPWSTHHGWSGAQLCALTLGICATGCGEADRRPPPNVVLFTVESLRPDHVNFMTGRVANTPALDALAAEGVVYDNAYSVTSWTLTSHASLFTGLYPSAHQTTRPLSQLGDSYHTLAEILGASGYQCAGVVSGPYLRSEYNLQQGFEWYEESPAAASNAEAHGDVTSPAMERQLLHFLDEVRDPSRPFFLFAYFWDPHYDYIPPAPYDSMYVDEDCQPIGVHAYESQNVVNETITPGQLAYVLSQYDGEIRWTDEHLGRFFLALKERGLWENTLVIVTADHGEEFFEHGSKGHKRNLYVESVHVPLVVKYPGELERGHDARLASLVDVMPTVLEVTNVDATGPLQGRSLLERDPDPMRTILWELDSLWYWRNPENPNPRVTKDRWRAIRRGDMRLVTRSDKKRVELFDLATDPREQADLASKQPERARELRELLVSELKVLKLIADLYTAGSDAELDEDRLKELQALGYIR